MLKQEDRTSIESSKIWNLEQNKLKVIDVEGTSSNPLFDYSLINKMSEGESFLGRFADNSTAEVRIINGEFKKINLT